MKHVHIVRFAGMDFVRHGLWSRFAIETTTWSLFLGTRDGRLVQFVRWSF